MCPQLPAFLDRSKTMNLWHSPTTGAFLLMLSHTQSTQCCPSAGYNGHDASEAPGHQMSADVAETYTHKWDRQHLHVWVWCLFCIEAKAHTVSYSCKVWHWAKHLCLWLIDCLSLKHRLLLHSETLTIVKLDSCTFFTNTPRAEELLGKSCVQHKATLIAFYSAIQFFPTSALWCLSSSV